MSCLIFGSFRLCYSEYSLSSVCVSIEIRLFGIVFECWWLEFGLELFVSHKLVPLTLLSSATMTCYSSIEDDLKGMTLFCMRVFYLIFACHNMFHNLHVACHWCCCRSCVFWWMKILEYDIWYMFICYNRFFCHLLLLLLLGFNLGFAWSTSWLCQHHLLLYKNNEIVPLNCPWVPCYLPFYLCC